MAAGVCSHPTISTPLWTCSPHCPQQVQNELVTVPNTRHHPHEHDHERLKVRQGSEDDAYVALTPAVFTTHADGKNEVNLKCKVYGLPNSQITWLRDGQVIPPYIRGEGPLILTQETSFGSVLKILDPKPEQNGLYTCVAKTSDRTLSNETTVTVLEHTSHNEACPVHLANFCHNGGTCYIQIPAGAESPFCGCPDEFEGRRCESHSLALPEFEQEIKLLHL